MIENSVANYVIDTHKISSELSKVDIFGMAVSGDDIPSAFTGIVTLRNDPDQLFLAGLDIHKIDLKTGKLQKMMGLLNPEKGEKDKNALVVWQNNRHDDHGIFAKFRIPMKFRRKIRNETKNLFSVLADHIYINLSKRLCQDSFFKGLFQHSHSNREHQQRK